jgi:hypothetical protein
VYFQTAGYTAGLPITSPDGIPPEILEWEAYLNLDLPKFQMRDHNGNKFLGWTLDEDRDPATATIVHSVQATQKTFVLYPVWEVETYALTFSLEGEDLADVKGEVDEAWDEAWAAITYGTYPQSALPNNTPGTEGYLEDFPLSKDGYTFIGWSTDPKATTVGDLAISGDATVFPIFRTSIPPRLKAMPGTGVYVDQRNLMIYGVPDRSTDLDLLGEKDPTDDFGRLGKYLYVQGDGRVTSIDGKNSSSGYRGTNTKINFHNNITGGNLSYTLVIFGDTNGDGEVTTADITEAAMLENQAPQITMSATPQYTSVAMALSFYGASNEGMVVAVSGQTLGKMKQYITTREAAQPEGINYGEAAAARYVATQNANPGFTDWE